MGEITRGNFASAGRIFGGTVIPIDPLQWEAYYPIFREMIEFAGIRFMYKGYPAMLHAVWNLHPWLLLRFETNFIERHCLLPGERVLESFIGRVNDTGVEINGNVFLTDYRLMVTGLRTQPYRGQTLLGEWITNFQNKQAQSILLRDFSPIIEFGFIVPYLYNYGLKLRNDRVIYKVEILYDKRGRLKAMKRKVMIRVQKLRSQNNADFKAYQKELLGKLFSRFSQVQHGLP